MPSEIPPELLSLPDKWQTHVNTIILVAMLVGRGFKALRSGGGLRGVWRGLMYGENGADK